MRIASWQMVAANDPLVLAERDEVPENADVIVKVAGCGVCHTDISYYSGAVPTRGKLPLTLGHEIAGTVVEAGEGAQEWIGRNVVVPAVLPCGTCPACVAGRGQICPTQIFPGNDVHGGFATHVCVPARGLCPAPELGADQPALEDLAVIADAVSTPYQAITRSNLKAGDVAIFVGAGGVGGFGVQIAAALGAHVIALDTNPERLAVMADYGATQTVNVAEVDFRALRKSVRAFCKDHNTPTWRTFIFETSGVAAGQHTAFGLIGPGGYLSMVGYTAEKVNVRLSNLMAHDATVQGNWGCLPELYPAVLDMVLSGQVKIAPFVEHRALSTINDTFADVTAHRVHKRIVLIPEGA